jgi:hypothetical protein
MSDDVQNVDEIFADSETLAGQAFSLIRLPLFNDSERFRVSYLLCSLSLEHWNAVRRLLAGGFLPSALIVHRAQFEATVRSVWALYGASDNEVSRLNESELTPESEQAAKNLPQVQDMMVILSKKAPVHAYGALERFKVNSWKALNSYTHAGIHPLRRHERGYPVDLVLSALNNANGLAVLACMRAVVLAGAQPLQRAVLDLATKYSHCMPPPL